MIYKVQVFFNKEFFEIEDNNIRIGINIKPIKGQANKEIIKKISKELKISQNFISIVSGQKDRAKIIVIKD